MHALEFVIAALVIVHCVVSQDGSDPPTCFQAGECTFSPHIGDWETVGAQECLEECRDYAGCTYFTYYEEEDLCWAFASCQSFSNDSCKNCYSGSVDCEDLTCWISGSCDGQYLDEIPAQSEEDCLSLCKADTNCSWFTYNRDDDACTLLEECTFLDDRCSTCTSGQKQCSERQDYTFLLTVGGYNPQEGPLDDAYLLDLDASTSTCDAMAPYPLAVYDPTAVLSEEGAGSFYVRVCGGSLGNNVADVMDCYRYDRDANVWGDNFQMDQPRFRPRSSAIRDTWFVTGGYSAGGPALASTLKLRDGEDAFVPGPDLPVPMACHCQLTVNSSHIFVADTFASGSTYLLEWDTEDWTLLSSVPRLRFCPACGLVQTGTTSPEIVVAGDGTSDIFSLGSRTWRDGPAMPETLSYLSSAQLLDTFMTVGGQVSDVAVDSIYRFDPVGNTWQVDSTKLGVPCAASAALLVPDGYVGC